jgi:hypothetical protein
MVLRGYKASDDTVSVVAGLLAPDSVELFMSYLSANVSSNGWYPHEAAVIITSISSLYSTDM